MRKLNFLTLIKALESIMSRSYETKTIHEYQAIPPNDRKMMSLIIRNLEVPVEGQLIRMDVGYQYRERVMDGITNYPASIIDVGDLSIYRGFEEFQAEGYKAIQGRWYENSFENMGELKKSNWKELVRAGYLGFVVNKISEKEQIYPVQVVSKRPQNGTGALSLSLAPGKSPTFILVKGDKKRILHNGKVYVLEAFLETLKEAFDMDN